MSCGIHKPPSSCNVPCVSYRFIAARNHKRLLQAQALNCQINWNTVSGGPRMKVLGLAVCLLALLAGKEAVETRLPGYRAFWARYWSICHNPAVCGQHQASACMLVCLFVYIRPGRRPRPI
jgi:hypothetical protein